MTGLSELDAKWQDIILGLIRERDAKDQTIQELTEENINLHEKLNNYQEGLKLKNKCYCTWCFKSWPAGKEGFQQFRDHIKECMEHPLQSLVSQKHWAQQISLKLCRQRNELREEIAKSDYEKLISIIKGKIDSEADIGENTLKHYKNIDEKTECVLKVFDSDPEIFVGKSIWLFDKYGNLLKVLYEILHDQGNQ